MAQPDPCNPGGRRRGTGASTAAGTGPARTQEQ